MFTLLWYILWENYIWSKCIQCISNKWINSLNLCFFLFNKNIQLLLYIITYLTKSYPYSAVCVLLTVLKSTRRSLLFSVTIDLYLAISFINNRWKRDKNRANCHLCARLNSEQGTTCSINLLLSVKELTVKVPRTEVTSWEAKGQRGISQEWKEKRWGEWVRGSRMICVGLLALPRLLLSDLKPSWLPASALLSGCCLLSHMRIPLTIS